MKLNNIRIGSIGICLLPTKAGDDIHSLDIKVLRELVWSERLIVLRGFKTFEGADDFSSYCEKWGEISIWPFGKVLELVERNNPEDHIFDNNYVPLHWDGMYRPQVPEFQVFHCVKAPSSSQGGRTTFSDTVNVLKNTPDSIQSLWRKVTGNYERKMEFYNSKTVSPLIVPHPQRGFPVIRYNEPPRTGFGNFVNPPIMEFSGVSSEELATVHPSLRAALYAPENFYAHEWQVGDVVVTDNFSLLHGREAFETQAPRHLRRIHILSNPPLENPHLVSYR